MHFIRTCHTALFVIYLACMRGVLTAGPVVSTTTEASYAEFYQDGHLQFGLCGYSAFEQQVPPNAEEVCFPNIRLDPSATFNLTRATLHCNELNNSKSTFKLLTGCRNTAECPLEGQGYERESKDFQHYGDLSTNHISAAYKFILMKETKREPIQVKGSIIINAYILKEPGLLYTLGDVYEARVGDTLVKPAIEFEENVPFLDGLELEFSIFSLNNSSKPSTEMNWVKNPLKGKAEMPNCWVLFSHKVMLDGRPQDMAATYPRVDILEEWILTIKFPSFRRSASYELLLRHSPASNEYYPKVDNIRHPPNPLVVEKPQKDEQDRQKDEVKQEKVVSRSLVLHTTSSTGANFSAMLISIWVAIWCFNTAA